MVDAVSDPKRDISSDQKVATYTTNGNSPQKLLRSRFVTKTIQGAILTIDQLIKKDVLGIRNTLGGHQTVLPKDIVRDVACSGTRIFRTPREVIRTSRDGSTPRDVNTAIATDILTPPRKNFNSTSNSPTWNRNQDIASSRRSVITTTARNADPLDAPINQILDSHGHPKSIFSKVIGSKIVSGESADIY